MKSCLQKLLKFQSEALFNLRTIEIPNLACTLYNDTFNWNSKIQYDVVYNNNFQTGNGGLTAAYQLFLLDHEIELPPSLGSYLRYSMTCAQNLRTEAF